MRKSLFLFCFCFCSGFLFAQAEEGKTIYFLKSELTNALRNTPGSILLHEVDTSYVFSTISIDYLPSDSLELSKKQAQDNLFSFQQLADYLKANAKTQKRDDKIYMLMLEKDKFFILEPLNKKKYKAYPIRSLMYVASQNPMGVLEDF